VFRCSSGIALAALVAGLTASEAAHAVDLPKLGGKPLTLDISNTTELLYHFDNRNDTGGPNRQTLRPNNWIDDNYVEWLNRLYVRSHFWKLSFGLRLDSAVYGRTLSRQNIQDLIVAELGRTDLALENSFAREVHSRYTNLIYPAKLWLRFRHKRFEATLGDFYAHIGRGLVFSVRKLDEVGIDTTVRGLKLKLKTKLGSVRFTGTAFAGQLNPIRVDKATGRVLHGSDDKLSRALFFGFPKVDPLSYYATPDAELPIVERAKPSYLEDNVAGLSLNGGPKAFQLGVHGAVVMRQSNSEAKLRCMRNIDSSAPDAAALSDACQADFPSFSEPEATRAHDQIRNFSVSLRVPTIANVLAAYLEVAGQQQREGRVADIAQDGSLTREKDLSGYAVYANLNLSGGPLTTTIEGKYYRSFFPIGANVDLSTRGFAAPEYSIVTYSRPPNVEAIYTEPLGAPDVCNTGMRTRVDWRLSDRAQLYGWVGRYASLSEIDPRNNECIDDPELRTDTWDGAIGTELEAPSGVSHYWAWLGAREAKRAVPQATLTTDQTSDTFYREGYIRYDLTQHLRGNFSLSMLGYHRHRFEPDLSSQNWNEGENLLALNYNPRWSFIFGFEYLTREGFEPFYFNGALQYRSKSQDTWYDRLTDAVRLFVGQRRSALRCIGGTCRVYPAFEGAKIELVSRF
jgi:hypothetical protein